MKHLGKYQNRDCYECSNAEYDKVVNSGREDISNTIFIIDGVMVKDNIIIGHYDGHHVQESYEERHFRKPKAVYKPVETKSVEEVTGAAIKEINYSDYTGVVDDFFANLAQVQY